MEILGLGENLDTLSAKGLPKGHGLVFESRRATAFTGRPSNEDHRVTAFWKIFFSVVLRF